MANIDFGKLSVEWKERNIYPFFPVIDGPAGGTAEVRGHGNQLMFSSCDYLGLSTDERLKEAAIDAIRVFGTNVSASIAISGQTSLHRALEDAISDFFNGRACALFTTSYLANLGVIGTIYGEGDTLLYDRFNHVSLFQGGMLSGASLKTYRHADIGMLENMLKKAPTTGKKVIVTDGLFSADGDFCLLDKLVELADRYGADVVLDSAHDVGTFGANGRGVSEYFDLIDRVDLIIGTMSKGFGSTGGFVVGRPEYINLIKLQAGPFHSSRTFSPGVAGASLRSVEIVRKEGAELRKRLQENVEFFLREIRPLGLDTLQTNSAIVPIVLKDMDLTLKASCWLRSKGVMMAPFIPPAVPLGKARLRCGITASHTRAQLSQAVGVLGEMQEWIADGAPW